MIQAKNFALPPISATSRLLLVVFLSLIAVVPSLSHARVHPIENVTGSPIPPGLDAAKVEKAIILGGMQRGWLSTKVADGHLQATINLRKHSATVDIQWDQSSYLITYKDSQNLKFKDAKIHGNYNVWVRNLNLDIQRSLAQQAL